MLGRTHVIGAGAVGVAISAQQGLDARHAAVLTVSAMLFARLPDMDRFLHRDPHHRSVVHSVGAGALILFWVWHNYSHLYAQDVWTLIVWGAAAGYLSHLLLDALTPSGIPLLLRRGPKVGLEIVSTGSLTEYLFCTAITMAAIWLCARTWANGILI